MEQDLSEGIGRAEGVRAIGYREVGRSTLRACVSQSFSCDSGLYAPSPDALARSSVAIAKSKSEAGAGDFQPVSDSRRERRGAIPKESESPDRLPSAFQVGPGPVKVEAARVPDPLAYGPAAEELSQASAIVRGPSPTGRGGSGLGTRVAVIGGENVFPFGW